MDPVTANSVNGSNFNRYWYANNNPYRFTDPDGRLSCTPGIGRQCFSNPFETDPHRKFGFETGGGESKKSGVNSVRSVANKVKEEVVFGANAIADGISSDYRQGGALGVVIGATGGRGNQGFWAQTVENYKSASLVVGPANNVDKKLVSLAASGAFAKRYGGYTIGQFLFKGPARHLGTYSGTARLVAATTLVNGVLVSFSWEVGSFSGAAARTSINYAARAAEGAE